jgi:hypothetical protein
MTRASGHLEEQKMKRISLVLPVFIALLLATPLFAQQQTTQPKSDQLTLDTVFTYRPKSLSGIQWLADGKSYSMLEPSPGKKDGLDIVRYNAATGEKSILVPAEKLVPQGGARSEILGFAQTRRCCEAVDTDVR